MPRKSTTSIPPPLVPKTAETKMDEARKEVMDMMLDPKNISPEKMPSFANLDSYRSLMDDDDDSCDNGGVVDIGGDPPADGNPRGKNPPEKKTRANPKTDVPGETYVVVPTPQKKKVNNFENLKVYDKLKNELKDEQERSKALEKELGDVRSELEATKKEMYNALEEARKLRSMVESAKDTVDRSKFDRVVEENDNLILKNSELELELSIANENLKRINCQNATKDATYTNPGYTKTPKFNDTRRSMNGYEDWI